MNKFKAGDRVKCIRDNGNGYVKIGQIYTVDSISREGFVLLKDEKPKGPFFATRFEPVSAVTQFYKGDVVMATQTEGSVLKGDVYTVQHRYPDGSVKLEGLTRRYNPSLFEPFAKNKFAAGERVRCISGNEGGRAAPLKVGEVYTVKRAKDHAAVFLEENDYMGGFYNWHFEKLKQPIYQPGDLIEVVRPTKELLKKGARYTVDRMIGDDDLVLLKEKPEWHIGFYPDRFRMVRPAAGFKVGDRVQHTVTKEPFVYEVCAPCTAKTFRVMGGGTFIEKTEWYELVPPGDTRPVWKKGFTGPAIVGTVPPTHKFKIGDLVWLNSHRSCCYRVDKLLDGPKYTLQGSNRPLKETKLTLIEPGTKTQIWRGSLGYELVPPAVTTVTAGEDLHAGDVVVKADRKDTNPKDAAASNRLDLSLVPSSATAYTALALQEGDFKYGGYNWRDAGVLASVYVGACMRHLAKWYNGEEEDPKTGVPHLANAIACLAVIIDAVECGELKDNRPPSMEMTKLLDRFEKKVEELRKKFPNGPKRHTEAGR